MGRTDDAVRQSDALVLFGITGDLPRRMIFPALYALAKHGTLNVPVVGVANSFLEPVWNRDHVSSVQIILAEDFGVERRGKLRKCWHPALCSAESPVAVCRAAGHVAAGLSGLRRRACRKKQGVPGHAPTRARRPGAWPVHWVP